jgi:hypothetical protein
VGFGLVIGVTIKDELYDSKSLYFSHRTRSEWTSDISSPFGSSTYPFSLELTAVMYEGLAVNASLPKRRDSPKGKAAQNYHPYLLMDERMNLSLDHWASLYVQRWDCIWYSSGSPSYVCLKLPVVSLVWSCVPEHLAKLTMSRSFLRPVKREKQC